MPDLAPVLTVTASAEVVTAADKLTALRALAALRQAEDEAILPSEVIKIVDGAL